MTKTPLIYTKYRRTKLVRLSLSADTFRTALVLFSRIDARLSFCPLVPVSISLRLVASSIICDVTVQH